MCPCPAPACSSPCLLSCLLLYLLAPALACFSTYMLFCLLRLSDLSRCCFFACLFSIRCLLSSPLVPSSAYLSRPLICLYHLSDLPLCCFFAYLILYSLSALSLLLISFAACVILRFPGSSTCFPSCLLRLPASLTSCSPAYLLLYLPAAVLASPKNVSFKV